MYTPFKLKAEEGKLSGGLRQHFTKNPYNRVSWFS